MVEQKQDDKANQYRISPALVERLLIAAQNVVNTVDPIPCATCRSPYCKTHGDPSFAIWDDDYRALKAVVEAIGAEAVEQIKAHYAKTKTGGVRS